MSDVEGYTWPGPTSRSNLLLLSKLVRTPKRGGRRPGSFRAIYCLASVDLRRRGIQCALRRRRRAYPFSEFSTVRQLVDESVSRDRQSQQAFRLVTQHCLTQHCRLRHHVDLSSAGRLRGSKGQASCADFKWLVGALAVTALGYLLGGWTRRLRH